MDVTSEGDPAFSLLEQWLEDPDWRQFTLLGDVGNGKTFLTKMFAFRLAKRYKEDPTKNRMPLLIDLRRADREVSLEGLISTHLAANDLPSMTFDVFRHALAEGRLVVLFDGFDEMAAKVNYEVTVRNFQELSRSVEGRAKVLLTCRTHYFRNREQEEEIIYASGSESKSEAATELYWDLITRRGYRIGYLKSFSIPQIEEYVGKVRPNSIAKYLQQIRDTYNLIELSQRPMLLDMIVQSLGQLRDKPINAGTLYQVFTDAWIYRDRWRNVVSPQRKLDFLTSLAFTLWRTDKTTIHYASLFAEVQKELGQGINEVEQIIELDSEIRTASFLVRDQDGYYSFAHKSYMEYFVARKIARDVIESKHDCLALRRLSPEVIWFICDLSNPEVMDARLTAIVSGSYVREVSENALQSIYSLRRRKRSAPEKSYGHAIIELPSDMQLDGAQLSKIAIPGARLRRMRAREASFAGADLRGCDLKESDFAGARFDYTDLKGADLSRSNLTNATFDAADLDGTTLQECQLQGANMRTAVLSESQRDQVFQMGAQTEVHTPAEESWELIYPILARYSQYLANRRRLDPNELLSASVETLLVRMRTGGQRVPRTNQKDLFWLVQSTAENMLARDRRFESLEPEIEEGLVASLQKDPTDEIFAQELLDHVAAELDELSHKIFLHAMSGEGLGEISKKLNVSESAVRRRWMAIRVHLMKIVAG